jgi:hypothetical protein
MYCRSCCWRCPQLCQWQFSAVFGGADNAPTILPRLLLAVSITLPVVCTHPWSAACAISHQYCRGGCWRCPQLCRGNYSAVFGGADNEANNASRLLLAVSAQLCQWCVLIRGRRLRNEATNTAAVALAVSATLPVANTLLFSAADNGANNTAAVTLLAVSITLPVVCHPWSACASKTAILPQWLLAVSQLCQWRLLCCFGGR